MPLTGALGSWHHGGESVRDASKAVALVRLQHYQYAQNQYAQTKLRHPGTCSCLHEVLQCHMNTACYRSTESPINVALRGQWQSKR